MILFYMKIDILRQELLDVYGTNEPQDAFHQRIAFCLKMHNDAVKV